LWIGRVDWGEGAEVQRASALTLRTSRALDVSADGEIATRTPAEFDVVPKALPVFVSEEGDDAFARSH
jgi:diacylglycerol kinase family enzyme